MSLALSKASQTSNNLTSTPLQKALQNLVNKWGNLKDRVAHRNEYIKDFNSTLQLTKTGRDVMDCFAKAVSPLISGSQIARFPEAEKATGAAMEFGVEPDPKNPGKYIKTIYFNEEFPPIAALFMYAHETKHGCNSVYYTETQKYMETHILDSDTPAPTKIKISMDEAQLKIRERDQNFAVDEMRAYRVNVELFKEISKAAPGLVCNVFLSSSQYGRQVLSASEYNATMDELFQKGTFPLHLVALYAADGNYDPKNVFQLDKNGLPMNKLRDDLVKKMEDEGIYVAK